jgi:GINS complex subunit 2
MEPAEIEFIAEKQSITIIPNFSENRITLLTCQVGPFNPSMPVSVPLWLAVNLKQQQRCRIQPPDWLSVEKLVQTKQDESNSELFTPMPSEHYIEISTLLLNNASDDIPQPDEVRALIKDIIDLRTAKLRRSIDMVISQQAQYGKVDNLTMMEINSIRSFLTQSLDQLHLLREHSESI